MKEKTVSIVMLAAGALSAVCFLTFRETAPLPVAVILKMVPTLLMCSWIVIKKIDRINWPILAGLFLSVMCDFFMELDGTLFVTAGMGCNMAALVFYTIYFVRSDPSLDLWRILPFIALMGAFYAVLFKNLGPNTVPTAIYCVLYIVFLWRASARLGEEDISVKSQIVCFAGSLSIAASDCLLGLMLFAVMAMWWTGLLLLMVTAELKKQAVKRKSENGQKN